MEWPAAALLLQPLLQEFYVLANEYWVVYLSLLRKLNHNLCKGLNIPQNYSLSYFSSYFLYYLQWNYYHYYRGPLCFLDLLDE